MDRAYALLNVKGIVEKSDEWIIEGIASTPDHRPHGRRRRAARRQVQAADAAALAAQLHAARRPRRVRAPHGQGHPLRRAPAQDRRGRHAQRPRRRSRPVDQVPPRRRRLHRLSRHPGRRRKPERRRPALQGVGVARAVARHDPRERRSHHHQHQIPRFSPAGRDRPNHAGQYPRRHGNQSTRKRASMYLEARKGSP